MANSSEAIGQTTTPGKRPHSKILVDGGDPQETTRIQQLIGFVDGQTTNPSLIVPARVLEQWAKEGMPLPGDDFSYKPVGAEIPYEELNLEQPWEQFNIEHELTRKGIQKFVSDYKATLRKAS